MFTRWVDCRSGETILAGKWGIQAHIFSRAKRLWELGCTCWLIWPTKGACYVQGCTMLLCILTCRGALNPLHLLWQKLKKKKVTVIKPIICNYKIFFLHAEGCPWFWWGHGRHNSSVWRPLPKNVWHEADLLVFKSFISMLIKENNATFLKMDKF